MKRPSLQKIFKNNRNEKFNVEVNIVNNSEEMVCPYNDCGRTFSNPILITNNSLDPPETYYGCPYCLSKIDIEPQPEEKGMEPEIEISEFDAILEKEKKIEEIREAVKKVMKPEKPKKKEKTKKLKKVEAEEAEEGCPYHFGYLKEKPKSTPIPEECLTCPKMVDCMLKAS